jgi:hypothetical protein
MSLRRLTVTTLAVAFATLTVAAPVFAKDSARIVSVDCSGSTNAKLKVAPDDGRLQVEWEVDSNRVGQTWSVRLTDQGVTVFKSTRITRAPSGSFGVERRITDRAGTDRIVATAYNGRTREVCRATLRY